jgi:FkbH-like protein
MSPRKSLSYPFDSEWVLRKRKSLLRELRGGLTNPLKKRIAILGGSTTADIRQTLDLFLLTKGIEADFYESEYGRFYEDAVFDSEELARFRPDLVFIHTTFRNIDAFPPSLATYGEFVEQLSHEVQKFSQCWENIAERFGCPVIQNNFDLPSVRVLGNLDAYSYGGRVHFVNSLNQRFAEEARRLDYLYLHDIQFLSAQIGLENWHDEGAWHAYKFALSPACVPRLAHSVTSLISALYGISGKCLVLDLDNTCWGGVVGDVGADNIKIGHETPIGEAHFALQSYARELKCRGIILAVASKNEEVAAREGLDHPEGAIKASDISCLKANWNPKDQSLRQIAEELNIGLDSLVFVDDNPAERELVSSQVQEVAVLNVGSDISRYPAIIDQSGCFETVAVSAEDEERSRYYEKNTARQEARSRFSDYGEYLSSLEMHAEIRPFEPVYLDRIFQLTNKTNQFNLTNKRCSRGELESCMGSHSHLHLYGKLADKFGDNGLVSVILGAVKGVELHLELWLMSCRVLQRDMEKAMFDQLVAEAANRGITEIFGYYKESPKNAMVRDHYPALRFDEYQDNIFKFSIPDEYQRLNNHIKIKK